MSAFKIAVIGAGSFVFGPTVLVQTLLERKLDNIELALVDVNTDILETMAAIGRRMAKAIGLRRVTISVHATRPAALDGAHFVICAAAVELRKRFAMDVEIISQHAPGHMVTEFGGICGIAASLRQIAMIREIAADIREHCPNAWLLNVSNPLPRIVQAAAEDGVKVAGFCSVSLFSYSVIWNIMHGQTLAYPFQAARDELDATIAGLNHLCWVAALRDKATGQDMYPALRERIAAGFSGGQPRCEELCKSTGYLLSPNDEHTADFFPPRPGAGLLEISHGSSEDRERRLDRMRQMADGRLGWDELLERPSWERPIDFVAAIVRSQRIPLHSLNLINNGQIPNLPRGLAVETPCVAGPDGPEPATITLPDAVLPHCQSAAAVTQAIVRAGRERSRKFLREAIDLDPTIIDKAAGRDAMDAALTAHADVLGAWC